MFEYNNDSYKTKKELDKEYEEYLDDPITYSIDEILQVLGPRREKLQ